MDVKEIKSRQQLGLYEFLNLKTIIRLMRIALILLHKKNWKDQESAEEKNKRNPI